MNGLDRLTDEDDSGTVFRDVLMLVVLGFVFLLVMVLPHLNPEGEKATAEAEPPGNVIVELRWPDELNTDVDLWVQAPGDQPVGYSNKGGARFNLLRDDLGRRADATEMNYEVSYSRGVEAGEYTVNVHLYRNPGQVYPVPATVVVSVKPKPSASARQILASQVALAREGEEMTVFRFNLDDDGDLVPGSVHSLAKPLRRARKS